MRCHRSSARRRALVQVCLGKHARAPKRAPLPEAVADGDRRGDSKLVQHRGHYDRGGDNRRLRDLCLREGELPVFQFRERPVDVAENILR